MAVNLSYSYGFLASTAKTFGFMSISVTDLLRHFNYRHKSTKPGKRMHNHVNKTERFLFSTNINQCAVQGTTFTAKTNIFIHIENGYPWLCAPRHKGKGLSMALCTIHLNTKKSGSCGNVHLDTREKGIYVYV